MPDQVGTAEVTGKLGTMFGQLHDNSGLILAKTMQDHATSLGKVMQIDIDLGNWVGVLTSRPEGEQLRSARRELGFACYAAASGMYMHAYGGLRLFLELSFAAIHFSVNELHRRRWLSDREDFSWSRALDADTGLLSIQFVQEFAPNCVDETRSFALAAAEQYRFCSQFMHGKQTHTSTLPATLTYSAEISSRWMQSAYEAAQAVVFLLHVRYSEELTPIPTVVADALESHLSTLTSVRHLLGLPVEER